MAWATLDYLSKRPCYGEEGHLRRIGRALQDGLNTVFAEKGITARCIGQPERSVLEFEAGDEARREWCARMIEKGVILDRPQFPTLAHSPADVEFTLERARGP